MHERHRAIRAFVDESESNRAKDPDTYLVGAVVVGSEDAAAVRERIAALKLRGQSKLHWRDESDRRRRQIIRTVADMPVTAVLAAHVDADRAPEARRHRALRTLLPALSSLGVTRVELESRGRAADQRDRKLFDGMRRSHMFGEDPPPMRIEHPVGHAEPGLWIADAICGAVVSARCGDPAFVNALGARLRLLDAP